MKNFWGYASDDTYAVGCTGQSVYVYDKNGIELAKFKDIRYGYTPMISPTGKIFVVKSTDGRLAVYSLETMRLLRKFRFSKMDGGQDAGFCFSKDGKYFINIELQTDGISCAVSVYNTDDFSVVSRLFPDEETVLNHIEYDEEADSFFVLGWIRGEHGYGFVAVFEKNTLNEVTRLTQNEYDFYQSYKHLEMMGFTEKAFQWSYMDGSLSEFTGKDYTLAKLFREKNISRKR